MDVIGLNKFYPAEGDFLTNYSALQASIKAAINADVPVIAPTGNTGQYKTVPAQISVVGSPTNPNVIRIFPCGMTEVICVGGVEPYHSSYGNTSRVNPPAVQRQTSKHFPVAGQEGLWIYPNSLYNTLNAMIWAPASAMIIASDLPNSSGQYVLQRSSGTSFSCPLVTGVVALMKSRNPGLTQQQVRQILFANRSLRVAYNDTLAAVPASRWNSTNYYQDLKMIDIPGVLTRAIDPTLSGQANIPPAFQENYRARPHIGLVEPDGSGWAVRLNESLRPAAPAHEKRKVMLQSVSDVQWANLAGLQGHLINAEGWSHQHASIKMGSQTLSNQQLELLKIHPTLPAPVIQQAEIHQGGGAVSKFSATHPFEVRIQGEHLAADLAASKSLILTFHHVSSSANRDFVMDFKQTSERLNNAGTEAVFVLDAINDNPGSFLQVGQRYRVSVKGPNGSSNQFSPSGNFEIQSEAASGSGFGVKSIPPGAEQLPINSYVYDKTGNRWLIPGQTLSVDPHDFVGIHFEQPIHNLEVKIGPVLVPIVDILENLAVIGIPDDLPAGVHDAVIKASGQTLSLEQVVSKAAGVIAPYPEPAHVPPSTDPGQTKWLQVDNLSEGNEARIYLNEALIATFTPENQGHFLELGPNGAYPLLTSQRNLLRFEVHNSSAAGYTYGFDLSYGGGSVFKDRQGDAEQQHKVRTREGQIDARTGLVYQEQLWLHNTAVLPVGAGDYWVKVYNLGADEEVLLEASNQIGDIQWPDGKFRVKAQYQTFYRKLPWSQEICLPNANCWCRPDLDNFCWSENELSARVHNSTGSYSYTVDVYKGIYLLSRQRDGQPNGWGANYNSQATDSWGVHWLGARFWKYGIP